MNDFKKKAQELKNKADEFKNKADDAKTPESRYKKLKDADFNKKARHEFEKILKNRADD